MITQVNFAGLFWNILLETERRKFACIFQHNIPLFQKVTMTKMICDYSSQFFWFILEYYFRDRKDDICMNIST